MLQPPQAILPFRWDLITPDRLGSMIADLPELDPEFLDALVDGSAKVLARSAGGDLVFVGRSLDSMFDLLGGALDGCNRRSRAGPRALLRAVDGESVLSQPWLRSPSSN
jgi:hypothetical protein